jgi:hypothetical protein
VIWAPDQSDEGALDRRLAVRERHLEVAKESMKAGYVTSSFLLNQSLSCALKNIIAVNGPLLSPESIASPDAPKKMIGSMLIVRGESYIIVTC